MMYYRSVYYISLWKMYAHSFKLSRNCILLYMLWKEEINNLFSFFWWPKHLSQGALGIRRFPSPLSYGLVWFISGTSYDFRSRSILNPCQLNVWDYQDFSSNVTDVRWYNWNKNEWIENEGNLRIPRISSYTRFKSEGTKSTNVLSQCILYIIIYHCGKCMNKW
jgi:hypothetical protein